MQNLRSPKSDDGDDTCPKPTFVFVMPRGRAYSELELTFVDLVYFPDDTVADG